MQERLAASVWLTAHSKGIPVRPAVDLLLRLAAGDRFTTRQVAEMLGIDYGAAWDYLTCISRVVPIYHDDPEDPVGLRWQVCK